MTDEEVLSLLRRGVYEVDLVTAEVFREGKKLKTSPNSKGYQKLTLAEHPQRRHILLHKFIWMAGTMSCAPPSFEVHHRDENKDNNSFSNLLCVHSVDHAKLHGEEDLPF